MLAERAVGEDIFHVAVAQPEVVRSRIEFDDPVAFLVAAIYPAVFHKRSVAGDAVKADLARRAYDGAKHGHTVLAHVENAVGQAHTEYAEHFQPRAFYRIRPRGEFDDEFAQLFAVALAGEIQALAERERRPPADKPVQRAEHVEYRPAVALSAERGAFFSVLRAAGGSRKRLRFARVAARERDEPFVRPTEIQPSEHGNGIARSAAHLRSDVQPVYVRHTAAAFAYLRFVARIEHLREPQDEVGHTRARLFRRLFRDRAVVDERIVPAVMVAHRFDKLFPQREIALRPRAAAQRREPARAVLRVHLHRHPVGDVYPRDGVRIFEHAAVADYAPVFQLNSVGSAAARDQAAHTVERRFVIPSDNDRHCLTSRSPCPYAERRALPRRGALRARGCSRSRSCPP